MVHQIRHALGDGQPEPQSLVGAGGAWTEPFKLHKNSVHGMGRNSRTGIPHFNSQSVVGTATTQQQTTSFGVVNGITEEVLQNTTQ